VQNCEEFYDLWVSYVGFISIKYDFYQPGCFKLEDILKHLKAALISFARECFTDIDSVRNLHEARRAVLLSAVLLSYHWL
jgi:hypothetical protein